MARGDLERAVIAQVADILGGRTEKTPRWLMRPGRAECLEHWSRVCRIYRDLTGKGLPEVMPKSEWRQVDAVLALPDGSRRIIEVDEAQHFNGYRATTLFRYSEVRTAFPLRRWLKFCGDVKREPGGGFAVPRPPLFPDHGGRHRQRAFRDALCDILPALYGFEPTLRIACFEVAPWIDKPGAKRRMTELLRRQGVLPRRTSHRLVRVRPQSEVARKSS